MRPSADGTDLRLIAVDMDGTLLDADGAVPQGLWPLLELMRERGIVFAPASGRQYATLRRLFDQHSDGMPFISENGAYVVRDEHEVSSTLLEPSTLAVALDVVSSLNGAGGDAGVVMCGKRKAFVERTDEAFLKEVRKYYVSHEVVGSLRALDEDVIKLAVFDFADASVSAAPALASISATYQVVVSGHHWVDVMARGVTKGSALIALQNELGVTRDQTAAFGDYLNDLEMLEAASLSFAMENAHPSVRRVARFEAPHHAQHGVVKVLSALLADSARGNRIRVRE